MNSNGQGVVVVGGGVIGLACAHYLERAGRRVTVIDRGAIGGGCSQGNCGLICPSHVLPLAEPGAVSEALRSMLRPGSPLRIQPRFDPSLWRWLWNFARRCNHRDMLAAGKGIQPLLEMSLKLYLELVHTEGLACEWQRRGQILAFASPQAMRAYEPTDRVLRKEFGISAERLNGSELVDREPALQSCLAGGWYYEEDAQVRPDRLLHSWRDLLAAREVTFVEHCEVFDWVRNSNGKAIAVRTAAGELSAQSFVLAAGAWTPRLARQLQMRVPLQPGKGYSITLPRPEKCPQTPILLPERRVVITPFDSGLRLGSIMEFAGFDNSIRSRRLRLLSDAANDYLCQPPAPDPTAKPWIGFRPMTYDSLPVIDRSPRDENIFVAAGHSMLGLSMAPGTGRLIADLVCDRPLSLDPGPYSARRFG
jgi:D-amino-acid dehydrogenase